MKAATVAGTLRSALRQALLALGVGTPVLLGAGWLVDGVPGVWGAAIGIALAAGFMLVTTVVSVMTASASPTVMAAAVLGSWLGKMIVLFVVLALLRNEDFYSRIVLFGVVVLTVIGVMAVQTRVILTSRVPYVDTTTASSEPDTGDEPARPGVDPEAGDAVDTAPAASRSGSDQ
ncbi:hypothetical protein [Actinoalloteichus spitiensis]|uniref:hypothetical protein n=1 Tax=Actinoalloteichus spitiensis TaxID=252394 RepID=UPI0003743E0E|nr:hypothetical protein [Actinoalloteichus spitiensis]